MSKIVFIYRGTDRSERSLLCTRKDEEYSLLSRCYSRAIDSSRYKEGSCVCFSEDPRVALKYAKKNLNPVIVKLAVKINDDNGYCEILDHEKECSVQRLWSIDDWCYIASKSQNYKFAENINYKTSPIPVENIISYTRGSARAYARADKLWVVSCNKELKYEDLLNEEEIRDIEKINYFRLPSLNLIKYTDSKIIPVCNYLINQLEKRDTKKAYIKYSIDAYKELKSNIELKGI